MNILDRWCSSLECLNSLQASLQVVAVIASILAAVAGYGAYHIRARIGILKDQKAQSALAATQNELQLSKKELFDLKAAQAPRQINPDQRQRIQQRLQGLPKPSRIIVTYDGANHETREFASQISSLLVAIGWQDKSIIYESSDARANHGFRLVIRDGNEQLVPLGEAIIRGFQAEGVDLRRLVMWHIYQKDPTIDFEFRVGQKP